MKILAILSRFPYPIDKGDRLRAYFQLKGLSKNNEVHLVCLAEEMPNKKDVVHIQSFCKSVHIIPLSRSAVLKNLFISLFNSLPYQVNYFRSQEMKTKISELISKVKFDISYVQLIRVGLNLPKFKNLPFYLDYMDALSMGMESRIPLSKWYAKPFARNETKRLKNYEVSIAKKFQGFSAISETDVNHLNENLDRHIKVIPNGVSELFFDRELEYEKAKYDIIFTGNMGYHPNIQSAKYLVQEILPLLPKEIKVCLAGTRPSTEVLALESDQVEVTGFVDDMRDYLAISKVFVAPLISGSGLQNKLLESMAMALPILTTPMTNAALGAKDGTELLLCNSAEDFADKIMRLLKEPSVAREIGANAKRFIEANYRWSACNTVLETELLSCVHDFHK